MFPSTPIPLCERQFGSGAVWYSREGFIPLESRHRGGGRAAAPRRDPRVGAGPQSPLPASPPSLGKKGQRKKGCESTEEMGSALGHSPSSPDAAQCAWQLGAPPTEVSDPKLKPHRARGSPIMEQQPALRHSSRTPSSAYRCLPLPSRRCPYQLYLEAQACTHFRSASQTCPRSHSLFTPYRAVAQRLPLLAAALHAGINTNNRCWEASRISARGGKVSTRLSGHLASRPAPRSTFRLRLGGGKGAAPRCQQMTVT